MNIENLVSLLVQIVLPRMKAERGFFGNLGDSDSITQVALNRIEDVRHTLVRESKRDRNRLVPLVLAEASALVTSDANVDALTGACLVLYFLGLPFPQPWERVLQQVDRTGVFPPGGSLSKAIGDLYRSERVDAGNEGIINMTYVPMAVFPDAIAEVGGENGLHRNVSILGRCYSALQMELYLRSRRPIEYLIPRKVFDELIGSSDVRTKRLDSMRVRGESFFSDNQKVRIVEGSTDALPGYILGSTSGFFTFVTLESGSNVPLGGGPIRKERRAELRKWLGNVKSTSLREAISAASQ